MKGFFMIKYILIIFFQTNLVFAQFSEKENSNIKDQQQITSLQSNDNKVETRQINSSQSNEKSLKSQQIILSDKKSNQIQKEKQLRKLGFQPKDSEEKNNNRLVSTYNNDSGRPSFQPHKILFNYIDTHFQNLTFTKKLTDHIQKGLQNLSVILTGDYRKKTKNKTKKKLFIDLESAFYFEKNNLIEKDYSRTYSIPYIDANISFQSSKNLLFQINFDFSYIKNTWSYEAEEVFIKYQWFNLLPADLMLGYFKYPILNLKESDHKFSKKTLLEKNLLSEKSADIGALLKVKLYQPFYFMLSSHSFIDGIELLSPLNTAKNTLTASIGYEKKNQHITAGYLKQNFFSNKQKQAFGLSSDLSYPFYSFLFNFKGEVWKIKQWPQDSLSYYMFPSIKWNRLALSFLFGEAYYQLNQQTSKSKEYILKTDFYLTDEVFISIEKINESDTIVKNSSWIFSLRSHFHF